MTRRDNTYRNNSLVQHTPLLNPLQPNRWHHRAMAAASAITQTRDLWTRGDRSPRTRIAVCWCWCTYYYVIGYVRSLSAASRAWERQRVNTWTGAGSGSRYVHATSKSFRYMHSLDVYLHLPPLYAPHGFRHKLVYS